jgi:hypothetical protein
MQKIQEKHGLLRLVIVRLILKKFARQVAAPAACRNRVALAPVFVNRADARLFLRRPPWRWITTTALTRFVAGFAGGATLR